MRSIFAVINISNNVFLIFYHKLELMTDKGMLSKTLDWTYNKAIGGVSGIDSAYELGNSFLSQNGTLDEQVSSLIKWQVAKSGTSGFIGGVGGLMTMPFLIPANMASVLYIQIRMIAAIAYMGGYDLNNDKVKSMIYFCLAGNSVKELAKDASIRVTTGIAQKAGQKMLAKFGGKGLSKAVPVMGGVVGGAFDAMSTKLLGDVARKVFINKETNLQMAN